MARLIGLFTRRQGMSAEEFRDYYENHHAPNAVGHFGHLWTSYSRHYLERAEGDPGPDVITEVVFRDEAALEEMYATLAANRSMRDDIVADEDRFFDRSLTQLHRIDDSVVTQL